MSRESSGPLSAFLTTEEVLDCSKVNPRTILPIDQIRRLAGGPDRAAVEIPPQRSDRVDRPAASSPIVGRASHRRMHIAADRTPLLFGTGTPWTTRSMVRVMQNFSTGSARVPTLSSSTAGAINRSRDTGTILGSVFTDWNANGTLDPDESPIENIPIRILGVSSVVNSSGWRILVPERSCRTAAGRTGYERHTRRLRSAGRELHQHRAGSRDDAPRVVRTDPARVCTRPGRSRCKCERVRRSR